MSISVVFARVLLNAQSRFFLIRSWRTCDSMINSIWFSGLAAKRPPDWNLQPPFSSCNTRF